MSGRRVGFACVWEADAPRTWSYTPWELREALRRCSADHEVVDLGIALPSALRRTMQLANLRRRGGRWVTPWEHWRPWEWGSSGTSRTEPTANGAMPCWRSRTSPAPTGPTSSTRT